MITEFGRIALPNIEVLRAYIPENKLWPPENNYWWMHASFPHHIVYKRRIKTLSECIADEGLPQPKDIDELIKVSQRLQAEALSFWIEHYSSDSECGGLFFFNFCDSWPQVSDAVFAYPFHPKPALEEVKKAYGVIHR